MVAVFATSPMPCLEYFITLKKSDHVVIDGNESYKKQSNRSRYHILSSNGIQTLSIPLQHTGVRLLNMNEVKIAYNENWQRQHWRSIEAAYNNSAYFIFYKDSLYEIFFREEEFLFQFNLNLLNWCLKSLKIEREIITDIPSNEIINNQNDFRSLSDFKNTNSKSDSTIFKLYPQVFTNKFDFTSNLSIIDLIFNTGPQAIQLL